MDDTEYVAWMIQGVTPVEKLVLIALATYCKDRKEPRTCIPKLENMILDTCMSKAQIVQAIHGLQKKKWLEISETVKDQIHLTFHGIEYDEH